MHDTLLSSKDVVLVVIKRIKVNKSPGDDQVLPRTLWEAREEIVETLAEIFALLLATDEDLEDWRVAIVGLLFKKGSKDKLRHYRPVCSKSVVGRLLGGDSQGQDLPDKDRLIWGGQLGFVRGK